MVVQVKKRDPRVIVVKVLMNADEYVAFKKNCEEDAVSHSGAFRTLAKQWDQIKSNARSQFDEWAKAGHVLPMMAFGSRVNFGTAPARLRS